MKFGIPLFGIVLCLLSSVFLAANEIPQNVAELYQSYDPRQGSLDVEVVREWDEGDVHMQFVIFNIGTFEGQDGKIHKPRLAGYYAYPRSSERLPGIVQIHGGGGAGKPSQALYWAEQGYACISISWSTAELEHEAEGSPNTDWDGLAAAHGRDLPDYDRRKFRAEISPREFTLSAEPNPLNSSYYLLTCAARRSLTFLEHQPEVDPDRLGITGHSMGGKATVYSSVDPRVKAAVPSVGGVDALEDYWGVPGSNKFRERSDPELFKRTIALNNYWPYIQAPVLFLNATNDFHAPMDNLPEALALHPGTVAMSLSPHTSHSFVAAAYAARPLWMEAHLKGSFSFPLSPRGRLVIGDDGVPVYRVWTDPSAKHKIARVDIFYGYDRDPLVRFWADGQAVEKDGYWEGRCPVYDMDEPLFAFANVTYEVETEVSLPGNYGGEKITELLISSDYVAVYPDEFAPMGVQPTAEWQRVIFDGSRGFIEWDTGREYMTRKLVDPRWHGPKGGKLYFKIETERSNETVEVQIETSNKRTQVVPRDQRLPQRNYKIKVTAKEPGIHEFEFSPDMFKTEAGETLDDWITAIEELSIRMDDSCVLKEIKWKGGDWVQRPKPF